MDRKRVGRPGHEDQDGTDGASCHEEQDFIYAGMG